MTTNANSHINRLTKKGRAKPSTIDARGSNQKQAVATSGKLRIAVSKENKDGTKNT